jgi:hypothetical protein
VTFTGIADPDRRLLDCVVDVNPRKQGCFLPGTGHPILAPGALAERDVRHAVLLNPNYHAEIAATLADEAPAVTLVDLMEESE